MIALGRPELRRAVTARFPFPLIALGGIGEANAQGFIEEGFAGVALLGYFASQHLHKLTERVQKLCAPTRPPLLGASDPTAEAGLTADMQHAARLGVRAYSLVTALTCQDAVAFTRLTAVADADLIEAVRALRRQSPPQVAKIGLIASLHQLLLLVREIRALFPPVASSGIRYYAPARAQTSSPMPAVKASSRWQSW